MGVPPQDPPLTALESWARERYGMRWPLRAGVLKFINSYRDRSGEPRPFVGRAALMRQLDQWLLKGQERLLLLSAAAGRGKSALLLNWLGRLVQAERPINLCYLPISIRFSTADESAGVQLLWAALCDLFSELKAQLPQQPEAQDYLRGIADAWQQMAQRPGDAFLLVVDALDEAINQWPIERHILPGELPRNLHVLISARHKPGHASGEAWLKDLKIDAASAQVLEMGCLEREAMAEAVMQLRAPLDRLTEREAFTDHLYRLTDDGDPLLLTLWLEQIWRARDALPDLDPAALARLRPGFGELYRLWMQEQQSIWEATGLDIRAQDFRQVLHVLAAAQGRLQLGDLVELLGSLSPGRWGDSELRTVLDKAHRLVAGDDTGYVLVHPRLAHYFQEELEADPPRRRAVHGAFREWGASTVRRLNSGELKPEECPGYLLTHYAAVHLDTGEERDASSEEYVLPLLRPGWAQAWHAREGAWQGYLNDLQHLARRLQAANHARVQAGDPPRLASEVRCVLLAASIRSLISKLPPELLAHLARAGVWSLARAVRVARQYELSTRADALSELAAVAALKGEPTEAAALLQEALQAATAIKTGAERADALSAVAAQLTGEDRRTVLRQALEAVRAIKNPWAKRDDPRVAYLRDLAPQLHGDPALLQQALEVAKEVRNAAGRAYALSAVAAHLAGEARSRTLEQALDAVGAIENEAQRASHLGELAPQLQGDPALQRKALTLVTATQDASSRHSALTSLTVQWAADAQRTAFERVLEAMRENPRGWSAAARLIGTLAQAHPALLQPAIAAAEGIEDEPERARALYAAAAHLHGEAQRTVLEQALAAAADIQASERVELLCGVAEELQAQARRWVVEQALELALTAGDESQRAKALTSVALRMQKGDPLLQRVLEAAAGFQGGDDRSDVLSALASRLPGEARQTVLQEALAAGAHRSTSWRVMTLTDLAEPLQGQARRSILEQALTEAASIHDESELVTAFINALAEALQTDSALLHRALAIAGRMKNEHCRRRAVLALAAGLQADSRLWQQALAVVVAIQDAELQALALRQVAKGLQGEARHTALGWVLEAIATIGEGNRRANELNVTVAELQGDSALLQRAWEVAVSTQDAGPDRVLALSVVLNQLQGEARSRALEQALEVTVRIEEDSGRAAGLGILADRLAEDGRLLPRAIDAAAAIRDADRRMTSLWMLAASLRRDGSSSLQQVIEAAARIQDGSDRARTLCAVAEHLDADTALLQQVLAAALGSDRLKTASAAAGQLQEEAQGIAQQALAVAAMIQEGRSRAFALRAVATQLQGEARRTVAQQMLEEVAALKDDYLRSSTLEAVARLLQQTDRALCERALAVAAALEGDFNRSRALISVARPLQADQTLAQQALTIAAAIPDEEARSEAVIGLTFDLAPALLSQALEAAGAIEDELRRSEALSAVASRLEDGNPLLDRALAEIRAIHSAQHRANALKALAAQLQGDTLRTVLQETLEAAAAIEDGRERARTLSAVAEQQQGEARRAVLEQALQAVASIQTDWQRADTLDQLTRKLPQDPQLGARRLEEALALPGTDGSRIGIAVRQARQEPSLLTYDLWVNLLHQVRLDRSQLLWVIDDLAAYAVQLTGRTEEAAEIASAIHDVCEWFP